MTTVSPCLMSKLRPCRISRSPNWTRNSRAEMMGAPGTASCISAEPSGHIEERGENHIHKDYHQDGNHDGGRGRAAYFFGAGAGGKTFLASHCRNNEAEHKALDDAGHDVGKHQRIARIGEVTGQGKPSPGDSEGATAQYAHEVRPDGGREP